MRSFGILLACVMAALLHSAASAHAIFVESVPPDGAVLAAPPTEIRLHFSEPIEPFGGGLSVIGPDGRGIALAAVRVEGADLIASFAASEDGTYLVGWRVVAEDTHPARGQVAFSVGSASRSAAETELGGVAPVGLALQVAARWLHFVGLALGFGTLAFGRATLAYDSVAGPRLWRITGWGVALLLVAELLALFGQTASFDASEAFEPAAVSAALDSSFGRAMGVRLGAAFLLWMLVGIAQGGSPKAIPLTLVVGWMLALFDGSTAHATSLQPTWLGLLVNALHLVSAVLWTGGLIGVVALWRSGEMSAGRLGRTALGSAVLLVLTGGVMALSHLPRLDDLFGSSYGLALVAKLVVVGAALGLAALGRRRAELVALSCALLGAGVLVSLPPPT